MYYLDFVTIIQLLKEFRHSGILRAQLPKSIVNTREICWIQLKLLDGEIVDRQILLYHGKMIVANQDVLHKVRDSGLLEWTFDPLKKGSLAPVKTSDSRSSFTSLPEAVPPQHAYKAFSSFLAAIPRCTGAVKKPLFATLTRQQRRVLILVDGKRTIRQIAAFFTPNVENAVKGVSAVLHELEEKGIVTL